MIYKKFIIIFLLILTIFSCSSVFADDMTTTQVNADLTYYVKKDTDFLKTAFLKNNIKNINDFINLLRDSGLSSSGAYSVASGFFVVYPVGLEYDQWSTSIISSNSRVRHIYITSETTLPQDNTGDGLWYNIPTRYKNVSCDAVLDISLPTYSITTRTEYSDIPSSFYAPDCWQWFSVSSLFDVDEQASAIADINEKITEDNSNQGDINLSTHNSEMNSASDSIKNSNLYSKFSNITSDMQTAFTYSDNDVSTLHISFYGKDFDLRSNEISSFFKNNNLGFVISLWQSILWFSLLYTMFLFVRKLYKAFSGGNPVDDVSNTLSSEDNKIVGGF